MCYYQTKKQAEENIEKIFKQGCKLPLQIFEVEKATTWKWFLGTETDWKKELNKKSKL